jgi:YihY family inner membrane protein
MSTARLVPETAQLSGDDARETLRYTGWGKLLVDAYQRLRAADGFSHARSLAFLTALLVVQGLIALVGLGTAVGSSDLSRVIVRSIEAAAPGPAGETLTQAIHQAERAGSSSRYLALTIGLVGALITGTTMVGQLERGLNRIYGVEADRPTLQKYGRAFVIAVTAGALATFAFTALAFGRSISKSVEGPVATIWGVSRWPIALLLFTAATAVVFQWTPRRRQPGWSWLAYGAVVSVGLWVLVTVLLGFALEASTSFGETYGPLAGIVALLFWGLLSSITVFYGGAVAAQLEAVRAGRPKPQDAAKRRAGEPAHENRTLVGAARR